MNELEFSDVQDMVLCKDLKNLFETVVQKLVHTRKEAKFTQQFIADWLDVDRRKIIALENLELFDIQLLINYCKKFDIEIKFGFIE